ncbi:MAG: hypothetical protein HFF40_00345 [Lawsonibacter sp.]|nr:hypothetical protein [Lawsonibacter sp.]
MGKFVDLTGQRFGRLTVIERAESAKDGHVRWLCRCDCGNTAIVSGNDLKKGTSRSCGCLRMDKIEEMVHINTIHGKSHSKLYAVWSNMLQRCNNPNAPEYIRYGKRGITVCKEWQSSFEVFYRWAISTGYQEGLSIDRIDNNKGYCPDNCRWATTKEQSNNVRSNRCFELNGEVKTMIEWCRHFSKSYSTVKYRLRHGWTIEEALDLVPHKK